MKKNMSSIGEGLSVNSITRKIQMGKDAQSRREPCTKECEIFSVISKCLFRVVVLAFFVLFFLPIFFGLTIHVLWFAYDARLFAIKEYGPIIHEFDPWFNYRATEKLENELRASHRSVLKHGDMRDVESEMELKYSISFIPKNKTNTTATNNSTATNTTEEELSKIQKEKKEEEAKLAKAKALVPSVPYVFSGPKNSLSVLMPKYFHKAAWNFSVKERFLKWYDHMSWFPLGRPVGTTIYPSLQFTGVFLFRALKILHKLTTWQEVVIDKFVERSKIELGIQVSSEVSSKEKEVVASSSSSKTQKAALTEEEEAEEYATTESWIVRNILYACRTEKGVPRNCVIRWQKIMKRMLNQAWKEQDQLSAAERSLAKSAPKKAFTDMSPSEQAAEKARAKRAQNRPSAAERRKYSWLTGARVVSSVGSQLSYSFLHWTLSITSGLDSDSVTTLLDALVVGPWQVVKKILTPVVYTTGIVSSMIEYLLTFFLSSGYEYDNTEGGSDVLEAVLSRMAWWELRILNLIGANGYGKDGPKAAAKAAKNGDYTKYYEEMQKKVESGTVKAMGELEQIQKVLYTSWSQNISFLLFDLPQKFYRAGLKYQWTLTEVCCYMPPWLAVIATIFAALLARQSVAQPVGFFDICRQVSRASAFLATAFFMSVIPAHAQRSIGGGFDNECIAIAPLCACAFFWCKSVSEGERYGVRILCAVCAAISHVIMAAGWGGYVFLINLVGCHAGAMFLLVSSGIYSYDAGRHMMKNPFLTTGEEEKNAVSCECATAWATSIHCALYTSYSIFYVIATFGAMQVPVINSAPLQSLEQFLPLSVFILMQVTMFYSISPKVSPQFIWGCAVVAVCGMFVGCIVIAIDIDNNPILPLLEKLFDPLSGRVKALFGHSAAKTGNPLIDSVSEHQPGSAQNYWRFLDRTMYIAPVGMLFLCKDLVLTCIANLVLLVNHRKQSLRIKYKDTNLEKSSNDSVKVKSDPKSGAGKKGSEAKSDNSEAEKKATSTVPHSYLRSYPSLCEIQADPSPKNVALFAVGICVRVKRKIILPLWFYSLDSLFSVSKRTPVATGGLFCIIFGFATYVFSLKMARLMILCGPPASVLSGIAVGRVVQWILSPIRHLYMPDESAILELPPVVPRTLALQDIQREQQLESKKSDKSTSKEASTADGDESEPLSRRKPIVRMFMKEVRGFTNFNCGFLALFLRSLFVVFLVLKYGFATHLQHFLGAAYNMCEYGLSHPLIVAKLNNGQIKDDYREAYWWIRDNTPADARILAWWDYGYQLAGLSNRITIADGNTWNHEHIAFLGLSLTSPVEEAHILMRHWADYVLIWPETDLAKATHMARIANSVYKGHCYDKMCLQFGHHGGKPSDMMGKSFMYQVTHGAANLPSNEVMKGRFREVFVSKNGAVRVMKIMQVSMKSRRQSLDPSRKSCDAPGSWYCPGMYPQALAALREVGFHGFGWTISGEQDTETKEFTVTTTTTVSTTADEADQFEGDEKAKKIEKEMARYKELYGTRVSGNLALGPKPNAKNIPLGSYRASCDGCSLRVNKLLKDGMQEFKVESQKQSIFIPMKKTILVCSHCGTGPGSLPRQAGVDLTTCFEFNQGFQTYFKELEERGSVKYASKPLQMFFDNNGMLKKDEEFLGELKAQVKDVLTKQITVDNVHGNLMCKSRPHSDDIVEGGYLNSCFGCRIDDQNGDIVCDQCGRADGARAPGPRMSKDTWESCYRNVGGDIQNENGALVCKGSGMRSKVPRRTKQKSIIRRMKDSWSSMKSSFTGGLSSIIKGLESV